MILATAAEFKPGTRISKRVNCQDWIRKPWLRAAAQEYTPDTNLLTKKNKTPLRRAPQGWPGPTQAVQIQAPKGEVSLRIRV